MSGGGGDDKKTPAPEPRREPDEGRAGAQPRQAQALAENTKEWAVALDAWHLGLDLTAGGPDRERTPAPVPLTPPVLPSPPARPRADVPSDGQVGLSDVPDVPDLQAPVVPTVAPAETKHADGSGARVGAPPDTVLAAPSVAPPADPVRPEQILFPPAATPEPEAPIDDLLAPAPPDDDVACPFDQAAADPVAHAWDEAVTRGLTALAQAGATGAPDAVAAVPATQWEAILRDEPLVDARELYEAALAKLAVGQRAEAATLCERALRVTPNHAPALRLLLAAASGEADAAKRERCLAGLARSIPAEAEAYRVLHEELRAAFGWGRATLVGDAGAGRDARSDACAVLTTAAGLAGKGQLARAAESLATAAALQGAGDSLVQALLAAADYLTAFVPPTPAHPVAATTPIDHPIRLLAGIYRLAHEPAHEAIARARALLAGLPPGSLRAAVARHAAWLAAAHDDHAGAAALLGLGTVGIPRSDLPLSDRLLLLSEFIAPAVTDRPADDPELPAGWADFAGGILRPEERALLCAAAAETLVELGRAAAALAVVRAGLDACPEAGFLSLAVERLALADSPARQPALALWRACDAGRSARAAELLAVDCEQRGDDAGARAARAEGAPGLASIDDRYLHEAWSAGLRHDVVAAAAAYRAAADAYQGPGAEELARAVHERASDAARAVHPSAAVAHALSLCARPAEALDHPRTLALALAESTGTPAERAALFRGAAMATRKLSPRVLEAAHLLLDAGQTREALQFLQARWTGDARQAAVWLVRRFTGPAASPEVAAPALQWLVEATPDAGARAAFIFRHAETLRGLGRESEAGELLQGIAAGSLRVDADRTSRAWLWALRDGATLDRFARDEIDAVADLDRPAAAVRALLERATIRDELLGDADGAGALVAQARDRAASAGVDDPTLQVAVLVHAGRAGDPEAAFAQIDRLAQAAASSAPRRLLHVERDLAQGGDPRAAAEALLGFPQPDPRLLADLLIRAADQHADQEDFAAATQCLQRALGFDAHNVAALLRLRRLHGLLGAHRAAALSAVALADTVGVPAHRAQALLVAAALHGEQLGEPARAEELFNAALEAQPSNEHAYRRLRALLEGRADHAALAALFGRRAGATTDFDEATTLRLARADRLVAAGDRAGSKSELREFLAEQSQHPVALSKLAELEFEDGAFAVAAEIYLRLARVETDKEVLKKIFRRLGRIYVKRLSDVKLATGAFERVIGLDPDNVEALSALSDLYGKQNDQRRAIAATERAIALETDDAKRMTLNVRLGNLCEKAGDVRQAGTILRKAVEDNPRSLQAVGELARYLERHQQAQARRVLLDTSLSLLRDDLHEHPGDLSALRTIVPLLRWRKRAAGSSAAAQLLGALTEDARERLEVAGWAVAPEKGRRLAPLANPEVDELAYPRGLPPGLRHVLRLVGPALVRIMKPDLKAFAVGKANRVPAGKGVREILDPIAADLGVRSYEVYLCTERPHVLAALAGDPAALVVGTEVAELGPVAVRFAGGCALTLLSTHFGLLLPAPGFAASGLPLLAGLIRNFMPGHVFEGLAEPEVAAAQMFTAKVLSRSLRAELSPFVAEIAAPVPGKTLTHVIEESACRIGVLASGDLATSLRVILGVRGEPLSVASFARSRLCAELFDFTLSPDFEVLVRALESVA